MLQVPLSVDMPRALWEAWFVSMGPFDSLDRLTFLDEQGVVTGESRVLHGLSVDPSSNSASTTRQLTRSERWQTSLTGEPHGAIIRHAVWREGIWMDRHRM